MSRIEKENSNNKNNKNVIILRTILFILVFCWMMVIFHFSSEVAEKSSKTSDYVAMAIVNHNVKTEKLPINEKQVIADELQHIVRKTAHFSIYTLGGIILVSLTSTYKKLDNKKRIFYAWILGTLYACTDEFHQYFVSGRSAEFKDVGIDSSGVLTGTILMFLIIMLINYTINKNKNKNKDNKNSINSKIENKE